MADLTTDNINSIAELAASIGDGDYIYIYKSGSHTFSKIEKSVFFQGISGGGSSGGGSSTDIQISDSSTDNSALKAAAVRQIKVLRDNLELLLSSLATSAFTNGRPAFDWVGTHVKYTLSYSLSDVTASVAAGQINEGNLSIVLTPTLGYAFATITVKDNLGNNVYFTRENNSNGTITISFMVYSDVIVSAIAVSGYVVELVNSPHVVLNNHSASDGETFNGVLTAEAHWSLPSSITVQMGGRTLSSGYTYNQGSGAISIDNVTAAVTITAIATEDAKYTVTVDSTGISNASASPLSQTVYSGESAIIEVTADEDCTLSSVTYTVNGGSQETATISNNMAVITIGNVTENKTVAISASASAPSRHNITYTLTGLTKTSGSDKVLHGDSLTAVFAKDADNWEAATDLLARDFVVYMGGVPLERKKDNNDENYDFTTASSGSSVTITIPHVTGDVEIVNVIWKKQYVFFRSYSGTSAGDVAGSNSSAHIDTYIPIASNCEALAVYGRNVNNSGTGPQFTDPSTNKDYAWGCAIYDTQKIFTLGAWLSDDANGDVVSLMNNSSRIDADYIRTSAWLASSDQNYLSRINYCFIYDITNDKFIWYGSSVDKVSVRAYHQE